jgi:putative DNA primase/helicase
MLTPEKIRRYYEARLQGQRFTSKVEQKLRCPFHDDQQPSLSINFEKGGWKCFAGCGQGGVVQFEMKFSECDENHARANVADLVGEQQTSFVGSKPEAVYQYHDASGRLVFEKLRYPGKRFTLRRPSEKGGWIYKLEDGVKPLYHLPEVLVSNFVIVTEGEKDADNVRALNLSNREKGWFVAATTNFDGAGKWRDEYSVYFAGKTVGIFPDNDEPGIKHAEQVAASIYHFTSRVRLVRLPGLPEKGDVSDYLKTHSADDLIEQIKATPQWMPATSGEQKLFIPVDQFIAGIPQEIDWLVEGLIQKSASGFFVSVPKGGKSWAAADLALSLAIGCPWMEFRVPRPIRVGLVSREDPSDLTKWRIRQLWRQKPDRTPDLTKSRLYVNSREQSPHLMLDEPEQMTELLSALKVFKPQFLIFDVFNVLHSADENDNQEMRKVLRQLSNIQTEIGCNIGVIHHYNKADSGSMVQRMRGSSAIAGWAQWLIGISIADEGATIEDEPMKVKIRKMEFESKQAEPPESFHWRIITRGDLSELVRVTYPPGAPVQASEDEAAERYRM